MAIRRIIASIAAGLVLAMAVAACGSSGSSESDSAGGTKAAEAPVDLTHVNAQLEKYTALPEFSFDGEKLDASKVRGKTIFNIPINSTDPYNAAIDELQAKIAKRLGLNFIEFPDTGQPSQWQRGVSQAVTRKADLIHLVGADPYILRPQIAAAMKQNIPVVSSRLFDVTQSFPDFVSATVPVDFGQAGRLMADWAISDTKGKANVLIVASLDVRSAPAMVGAIKDEFAQHCKACTVKVVSVPIADWATKMQTATQSALARDPNVNYILPVYDSMSQFVVPAIAGAGRTGKVFIATYNGTPFVLKMMQNADVIRMNVGEDLDWLARAQMDQNLRVLLKMTPVKDEHMALRVFTKKNVHEAGTPPAYDEGYGKAYIEGYDRLWGLG